MSLEKRSGGKRGHKVKKLLRNGCPAQKDTAIDIADYLRSVNISRTIAESEEMVKAVFDRILQLVMEEQKSIYISGFGKFYPKIRHGTKAEESGLETVTKDIPTTVSIGFKKARNDKTKKITGENL